MARRKPRPQELADFDARMMHHALKGYPAWLVYHGKRYIGIVESNYNQAEPFWTERGFRLVKAGHEEEEQATPGGAKSATKSRRRPHESQSLSGERTVGEKAS